MDGWKIGRGGEAQTNGNVKKHVHRRCSVREERVKSGVAFCGCNEFFFSPELRAFLSWDLYTMYPACVDSRVSGGYIRVTLAYRKINRRVTPETKEGRRVFQERHFVEKTSVIRAQTRTSKETRRKNGILEFTPRPLEKRGATSTTGRASR